MAENDPTKDQTTIRFDLSRNYREFLKEVFTMARDGADEELREHGRRLQDPDRLRREQAAYERLLAALDGRLVEPDPELLAVLQELVEVVDESNEYRRVVAEHEALHAMIASFERPRGSCSPRRSICAAIRCRGDNHTSRH